MRQHNRNRAASPSLLIVAGVAFCVTEILTGAQEKPADLSTEGYTPIKAEAKQLMRVFVRRVTDSMHAAANADRI